MTPEEISEELAEEYANTVVEISYCEKTISHMELHQIWKSDFYMVTAANPYSQLLPEIENESRNRALCDLLSSKYSEILSATGRDADGMWVEQGWVVRTNDEVGLIALAREFQQNAIFKFGSQGKETVNCLERVETRVRSSFD